MAVVGAGTAAVARGGVLRGAVAAEWTKLWSLRSTWWGLAGAFGLMVLMVMILSGSVTSNNTNDIPGDDMGVVSASSMAISSMDIVQFVVLALAILTITGEYATGSMRTTVQWVPRRGVLLTAKSVVLAAVVFPTGVLLGLVGSAVAFPLLGEWGRLSPGETLADSLAIGVYLTLVSVLMLGVGALLRSTAGAVTTAFLFLMALPMLVASADTTLTEWIADSLPSTAGRYFMNGESEPYGPEAGLGILILWTVVSFLSARAVLIRRDT